METSSDVFDTSSSSVELEYHAKELERILNTEDSRQNAETLNSSADSGSIGSDTSIRKRSRLMSKRTFNQKRANSSQSQGNLPNTSQANLSANSLFEISDWNEGNKKQDSEEIELTLVKKKSQGNAKETNTESAKHGNTSDAIQGSTTHSKHGSKTQSHARQVIPPKARQNGISQAKQVSKTNTRQDSMPNAKLSSKVHAKQVHAKGKQSSTTSHTNSQTRNKQVSTLNAIQGCRADAKSQTHATGKSKTISHAKRGSLSAIEDTLNHANESDDQIEMEDFRPERISFVVRKKNPVQNTVKSKPVKKKTSQDWKTRKAGVRKANQTAPDLFMPKITFQRIVREIMQGLKLEYRIQSQGLAALQEAAEYFLTTEIFEKSTLASSHAKRVTLQIKDIQLLKKIRRIE